MALPTAYSWTLIGAPGATPLSAGSGVGAGAPQLPCPIDPFSQQELLDLFDRIYPPHYLVPLKTVGPGYEALQAFAAIGARLSTMVERLGCASFILSAGSGAYATGEVELYRGAVHPEGITVTVKAGTVVACSRSGRRFVTTADVTFAPAALGPFAVPVKAVAQGYDYNVPGLIIAADGTALEGEIDTVYSLSEDPEVGDTTIQVRQTSTPASGGADPALDQHGADRGIPRVVGESDTDYRARVRSIPDNISPDAVERVLVLTTSRYNIAYELVETWDVAYQTCWDGPTEPIAGSNYDPRMFVWDDPDTDGIPFRNRWMDENEYRGCFIAVVAPIQPLADVGMVYDDTAVNAAAHVSPLTGGRRAFSSFDVPSSFAGGLSGSYDGFDLPRQAVYKGLYDTLQNIKAAGIAAVVELRGE